MATKIKKVKNTFFQSFLLRETMSDADVGAEGGAGISAEEPCPLEFFCNEVFLSIYQVAGGWGGEGIYYGPPEKNLAWTFLRP